MVAPSFIGRLYDQVCRLRVCSAMSTTNKVTFHLHAEPNAEHGASELQEARGVNYFPCSTRQPVALPYAIRTVKGG